MDDPEDPKWLSVTARVFAVIVTVVLPTTAALVSAGLLHAREFLHGLIEGNPTQVSAFGLALIGSTAVTYAIELCRLRADIARLERLTRTLTDTLAMMREEMRLKTNSDHLPKHKRAVRRG